MQIKLLILAFLFLFAFLGTASAATYYVSPSGSDLNPGTETQPWKTISKATSTMMAGDTTYVRGGTYKESIPLEHSGTNSNRITLKNYPGETPIIDGSTVATGWTKCANAGEAGGNPNYAHIYYAYLPAATTLFSANLFQNNQRLAIAQGPNPADIFYIDAGGYTIDRVTVIVTPTSITDPNLANRGGADLVGKRISLWCGSNEVVYPVILTYDANTTTITFASVGPVYTDRNSYYSILNSLDDAILDREGEYVINEIPEGDGTHKVWLWSLNDQDLSTGGEVTVSWTNNPYGLLAGGTISYVTIDGLTFTKGINRIMHFDTCTGITIKNCIIYNCKCDLDIQPIVYVISSNNMIFENNTLYDSQMRYRGIQILMGSNHEIKNNTITHIGGTSIYYGGCLDSSITGNVISGSTGSHSNGITAYSGCSNILVAGNKVINSNAALTWQNMAGDLIIYNNLFHGWGLTLNVIASWGGETDGAVYLLNNIVIGSSNHAASHLGSMPDGEYSVNNIIDGDGDWCTATGSPPYPENYAVRTNNIYVGYGWVQTSFYGWSLHTGEVYQPDQNLIFVNPYPNTDFNSIASSPAINAGADISSYLAQARIDFPGYNFDADILGNPRDSQPDVGAYEFQGTVPLECIDNNKLMDYIFQWKQGSINMPTLMQKIAGWKAGTGC